jgi:membrane-bound lytic murein transglycosylase D
LLESVNFVMRIVYSYAHLRAVFFAVLLIGNGVALPAGAASESAFPMPAGLEPSVEFWKQVFSRYSVNEVVFFDPEDPGKIFGVLRAPDGAEGRGKVEKERARIIADYDLIEEDGRIRGQRGAKENFIAGLSASGRYIGRMKEIFRGEGLPADLAYLPLVESSFNWRARSSAGALGMWQFMAETGKKFLRINDVVDERRDPLVSTRAAAQLLKQNYKLFGNWPLAITAYNHGTEGIFRGIDATGSKNLLDLIQGYQSPAFGYASKNFYAEFLAAVMLAKRSEDHFPNLRAQRPLSLKEVEVKRALPLRSLLKPASIAEDDFYEWNPAFHTDIKLIPAGYSVKLRTHKVDAFQAAQRRLTAATGATSAKKIAVKNSRQPNVRALKSGRPSAPVRG